MFQANPPQAINIFAGESLRSRRLAILSRKRGILSIIYNIIKLNDIYHSRGKENDDLPTH